jgi:probable rRNA maturation factor
MQLELSYAARAPWVPSRAQFVRWIEAALAPTAKRARARRAEAPPASAPRAEAPPTIICVRVVGLARSRSLNLRYRRKHRATNVLSFAGAGPLPDGSRQLGELVICAPVVAAEARSQKKSIDAHWAHMTVHGVLHLLGFDHEVAAEAVKMESREVQILDRLGFSNPYA